MSLLHSNCRRRLAGRRGDVLQPACEGRGVGAVVPVRRGEEEGHAEEAGERVPAPTSHRRGCEPVYRGDRPGLPVDGDAEGLWVAAARPSAVPGASGRPGAPGCSPVSSTPARPPTHLAWEAAGLTSPPRPATGAMMTEMETQTRRRARPCREWQTDKRRETRRRETRPRGQAAPGARRGQVARSGSGVLAPDSTCLSRLHPRLRPLISGHYHVVGTPLECAFSNPHSWGAGPGGGGGGPGRGCYCCREVLGYELGSPGLGVQAPGSD